MTRTQLELRLSILEGRMAQAHNQDLPALNRTYQAVLDRLVALDLAELEEEPEEERTQNRKGM